MPMRGATAWGTNSTTIKEVLAHLCSAPEEEHQPIQGSNAYGKRSVQKASWTQETCDRILLALEKEAAHRSCLVAFAGEMAVERADDEGPIDAVDGDESAMAETVPPVTNMPDAEEREQEMLDSLVLVGFPEEEYKRRKAWLSLPRTARAAIRRMHRMLSHKPKSVMLHILKGARADPVLIEAVRHFRCPDCPEEHTRAQPVKAPSLYLFNFEVVVDVLEIKDDAAERYSCLSCVCNGTTFHLVWMVSVGGGQPKSTKCLRKFLQGWVAWAGLAEGPDVR